MALSDKVKNAAKTIAEKHANVLQRERKVQADNLELAQSIVEELNQQGYNTEVITATLAEMGYDEGLMEYLQLTPTQTVGEVLAGIPPNVEPVEEPSEAQQTATEIPLGDLEEDPTGEESD